MSVDRLFNVLHSLETLGDREIAQNQRISLSLYSYQRQSARPFGVRANFTSDRGKIWSEEIVLRDDVPISNGLAEPNVKVVGPDDILLPASTYIFDNGTGIGELNLGEKDPVGIYRITVDRSDTFKWRIRRTGKVMPFHPEKITLGIMYTAPPKLVQDIREGALTTRRTYFFVPEHTKTFSIRVSYQKDGWQAISLIRPDGTVTEHKGYTLEVKPKPEECGKVWGVRAKEPYNELMNIQTRSTVRPTFLKLHGVPPFVAGRSEMLFVPD